MSFCTTYKISDECRFVHKIVLRALSSKKVANIHSLSMIAKCFSEKYFSDVNKKQCPIHRLRREIPCRCFEEPLFQIWLALKAVFCVCEFHNNLPNSMLFLMFWCDLNRKFWIGLLSYHNCFDDEGCLIVVSCDDDCSHLDADVFDLGWFLLNVCLSYKHCF